MRKLDVYLRTHSGRNVHVGERLVPVSKEVLIEGCVRSLLRSLEAARSRADIVITIIDDHSTDSMRAVLERLLAEHAIPGRLVFLPDGETGNSASIRYTYKTARETARDLIYFVEDDYLHASQAVHEMLGAHALFSTRLSGAEVGIFPVDYPDYYDRLLEDTRIVMSESRHFRTVRHCTGTFMLTKKLLISEWEKFAALSLYGIVPEVTEHVTTNRIWMEERAFLFAPVPTLALHLQFLPHIAPFTDWKAWWSAYAFPQDKKWV
jgi:hypothetical protein